MTGYCLEELAFWDKLSDQERDRVRAAAYEADYEPGQMIWSGERDCLGLLLIRSGVVRLFLLSEDGREATISRISGGQVCIMTASCTMSVSSFNVQVQAEGRVEAVVIPAVCLSTLVRDNLYVENFLYRVPPSIFPRCSLLWSRCCSAHWSSGWRPTCWRSVSGWGPIP